MNKYTRTCQHTHMNTQSEAVLLWLDGFGLNWHAGVKTLPHGLPCILTLLPHCGCVCVWPDLFSHSSAFDAKFTLISSMRKVDKAFNQTHINTTQDTDSHTHQHREGNTRAHTHMNRRKVLLSGTNENTWSNCDVWLSLETFDQACIPWFLSHIQTKG